MDPSKGTTEDEMAGWHHQLDAREFGWTLGVGDGQGGQACWFMGLQRVGHDWATELNWTRKIRVKSLGVLDHKNWITAKIYLQGKDKNFNIQISE